MTSPLQAHALAFVCPRCRAKLREGAEPTCSQCGTAFPVQDGVVDFVPELNASTNVSQAILENPMFVALYEPLIRVNFVRLMARNFNGALTPELEDAYLQKHLRPVDGPVLDLACGAGRWTRTLAELVGLERLIALDLSRAMLDAAKEALPHAFFVRGNAQQLPLADASLGAVSCWNSLQLLPDPPQALREVARCLRPGGVFTCFTYRRTREPLYGYFQSTFARNGGVRPFDEEELRQWLTQAGLVVDDLGGPNLALLFTARKPAA
ncbi:methyltransferase domain-containing protein [Stigmatella erecta]|uniref:Ubiquinone/menaquinone biosynthesis C-methylase UbiE n=1 Tax=Stigmatella erecta TaxID=83460 RepID=A0A1I0H5J2_9BACT|nr:methyltransferase domain-containing protein [Stigmatella erecta]SET79015.1 Ubiquinone/menaquinone biosynthesis C-methylase UbiE [Stigmatella erecta]